MNAFDPWSVLVLIWMFLLVTSGLCLCYAVGADAAARDASGFGWAAIVFLLPIAAPVYAAYTTRLPSRNETAESAEKWMGAVGIGGTAAIVVTSLVTPPDPFLQVVYSVPLALVFVPSAAVVCYDPGWRALVKRA